MSAPDRDEAQRRQEIHERRQARDRTHDPYTGCWCCCVDCGDDGWGEL